MCLQNSECREIDETARYPQFEFFGGAGQNDVFAVVALYGLSGSPGKGVVAVEIEQQRIFCSSSEVDDTVISGLVVDDVSNIWLGGLCDNCCLELVGYLVQPYGHIHSLLVLAKKIGNCGSTVWHDKSHIHGSKKF